MAGLATGGSATVCVNLVVLARSYGTQPRRLISPDEWGTLDERERLILTELGAANYTQQPGPDAFRERTGVTPADELDTGQPSAAALTAAAARDSLAFVSWAETSNVSASTLDYLTSELTRIAINYVHAPLVPLFRDLTGLRGLAFELLRSGRQHPSRPVSCSSSRERAACCWPMPPRTWVTRPRQWPKSAPALACAEQAAHHGLRAWTYGTAALIAEWTHQHRRAIEFAQRGAAFAATTDSRVRLAALEARAAARTGDRCLALDALERATRAREVPTLSDELEEFGGFLRFPLAKQHYYAGSTYALLGEPETAQDNACWPSGCTRPVPASNAPTATRR